MFDDEFIDNLPENYIEGLENILQNFCDWHDAATHQFEDNFAIYPQLIEAYSFLLVYLEKNKLPNNLYDIDHNAEEESNIKETISTFKVFLPGYIEDHKNEIKKENKKI